MITQPIIVGVVVGGVVAIVGALAGHFLRLQEMRDHWEKEKQRMEALWAEEERRRKSDRRREVCENDLKIVRESVDALVETMQESLPWYDPELWNWPPGIIEAYRGMQRARLVAASLKDQELVDRCERLRSDFGEYIGLLESATGKSPDIGGAVVRTDKLGKCVEKVMEEAPQHRISSPRSLGVIRD